MNDNASILLSIAPGLKNLLECCGLFTVKSVTNHSRVRCLHRNDTYVAGIIAQAAKKSLKDSERNIATTAAAMVSIIH